MKTRGMIIFVGLLVSFFAVANIALPSYAACQGQGFDCVLQEVDRAQSKTGNTDTVGSAARMITNTIMYIAGALAVIMIVVGGIQYVTSNGDGNKITAAKNTIMYAVIGLVVAIVAYAIVNYVIVNLSAP